MVRKAYTLRAEDDDFGQAGTLVREVVDNAARVRLVGLSLKAYTSEGNFAMTSIVDAYGP